MTNSNKIPQHIAIIMDGNRRWAKQHGKPIFFGHKKGFQVLKKIGNYCLGKGVKFLTVFAFSTENWNRPRKEVDFLVKLFEDVLRNEIQELHDKNICIRFIGRIERFSKTIQKLISHAVELTKNNTKGVLNIAVNYGGRAEILDAVRNIMGMKLAPAQINEDIINRHLYTQGEPDPDFIIRTSGELRLSGFLPWQSVYSELIFIKKHWPDFTEKDLDEAIEEYYRRQRRFGK